MNNFIDAITAALHTTYATKTGPEIRFSDGRRRYCAAAHFNTERLDRGEVPAHRITLVIRENDEVFSTVVTPIIPRSQPLLSHAPAQCRADQHEKPTTMTPFKIARAIRAESSLKVRSILTVEICEGLDGWAVRARIDFTDRRRSDFTLVDFGDTRDEAINTFIERLPTWGAVLHKNNP